MEKVAKENPGMNRTILIVLAWLLVCFIWGSTWISLKIGLQSLPPISLAGFRVLVAAVTLTVIIALLRLPFPRTASDWLLIAKSGVLMMSINYAFVTWGTQHVSAGLGAILYATTLIFGFVLAHFLVASERLSLTKVVGIALGLSGVVIIFYNQISADSPMAFWGGAAILVAAFASALASVLVKIGGGHLDRRILTAGQMWVGFIPLFLIGFLAEGNPLNFNWTTNSILALGYLAIIGSIVAFVAFYWLVKQIDVTKTMLIMLVTPLVATTIGIWLLDETVTLRIVLGGACILAGVAINLTRKQDVKAELVLAPAEEPDDDAEDRTNG